jgi:hypothetical protein
MKRIFRPLSIFMILYLIMAYLIYLVVNYFPDWAVVVFWIGLVILFVVLLTIGIIDWIKNG